jgi:hypothetical protein
LVHANSAVICRLSLRPTILTCFEPFSHVIQKLRSRKSGTLHTPSLIDLMTSPWSDMLKKCYYLMLNL